VYNKPESEDLTEGQKIVRAYMKERPAEFVRQMAQMELQNKIRAAKNAARLEKKVDGSEGSGPVVPDDDGTDRVRGLLERALEEFDALSG
jgi:hypothetical protein